MLKITKLTKKIPLSYHYCCLWCFIKKKECNGFNLLLMVGNACKTKIKSLFRFLKIMLADENLENLHKTLAI